jgi:iron complex transport system ATP-binding protein
MTGPLQIDAMSVTMGGKRLVDQVSFSVPPGQFVALIGPNGAGKSMLVKAMLNLVPGSIGTVTLNGIALSELSVTQRARKISYLPQETTIAWPARVRDIIALGRFAYGASASRLSSSDRRAIDQAISDCQLEHLADRTIDTLSGGERARVHMARAFCAETPFLIADEPTAALDPAQTFHSLDLLKAKARQGTGLLIVMHDLPRAAQYADYIVGLRAGRLVISDRIEAALSEQTIRDLYGVSADVRGRDVKLLRPGDMTPSNPA